MLTAKIVEQAFLTAHEECDAERKRTGQLTCNHAGPLAENHKLMHDMIYHIANDPEYNLAEALVAVFSVAFHVGYRAAQLEQQTQNEATHNEAKKGWVN